MDRICWQASKDNSHCLHHHHHPHHRHRRRRFSWYLFCWLAWTKKSGSRDHRHTHTYIGTHTHTPTVNECNDCWSDGQAAIKLGHNCQFSQTISTNTHWDGGNRSKLSTTWPRLICVAALITSSGRVSCWSSSEWLVYLCLVGGLYTKKCP